jgi:predicted RNA-binding protein with PUA-like domain
MARWLFKEEPDHYNYADLEREKQTIWDGVANNLALQHLRRVAKQDRVFYYHTGDEKAIVAIMEVTSDPYPDPHTHDEKLVVVNVRPVQRLARPVTLSEIKADPAFADWDLVKNSRLSVMPVSSERWKRIEAMSKKPAQ